MHFQKFLPITKVDMQAHTIVGLATAEVADKDGEICDYQSAKEVAYPEWSNEAASSTKAAGQEISYGNIRLQHTLEMAGKVSAPPSYVDNEKAIYLTTTPIDEAMFEKAVKGYLRGMSQGGEYRWRRCNDCRTSIPEGKHCSKCKKDVLVRYSPVISEVSYVDNPALGKAVFTLVKADGSSEVKDFVVPDSNTNEHGAPVSVDGISKDKDKDEEKMDMCMAADKAADDEGLEKGGPGSGRHKEGGAEKDAHEATARAGEASNIAHDLNTQGAHAYAARAHDAAAVAHTNAAFSLPKGADRDHHVSMVRQHVQASEGHFRHSQYAKKSDESEGLIKAGKGIQFSIGFKDGKSEVQSVVFDKDKWTTEEAKQWLKDNNFSGTGVDEKENTLRFRQHDPDQYDRIRMKTPGKAEETGDLEKAVKTTCALLPLLQLQKSEAHLEQAFTKMFNEHGERIGYSGLLYWAEIIRSATADVTKLQKGLGTVAQLAQVLQSLAYMCCAVYAEQEAEGDEDSTLPEDLYKDLESLAGTFLAMAEEEVSEMTASVEAGKGAMYMAQDTGALAKAKSLAEHIQKAKDMHKGHLGKMHKAHQDFHDDMSAHLDKMYKVSSGSAPEHGDSALSGFSGPSNDPTSVDPQAEGTHSPYKAEDVKELVKEVLAEVLKATRSNANAASTDAATITSIVEQVLKSKGIEPAKAEEPKAVAKTSFTAEEVTAMVKEASEKAAVEAVNAIAKALSGDDLSKDMSDDDGCSEDDDKKKAKKAASAIGDRGEQKVHAQVRVMPVTKADDGKSTAVADQPQTDRETLEKAMNGDVAARLAFMKGVKKSDEIPATVAPALGAISRAH